MSLAKEVERLDGWLTQLPVVGMRVLGGGGSPMYVLDFIAVGAVKRSLSLASGLAQMIRAKNMVCARALLRMHLDTITRFLAYTYVKDAEAMALAVVGGASLKKFKCSNGKPLTDAYLVDRLSQSHPWARRVYEFTSGYVHFSERQFFDSVRALGDDDERMLELQVSHIDSKYPEFSWHEVAECFNQLTDILVASLASYEEHKATNPSFRRRLDASSSSESHDDVSDGEQSEMITESIVDSLLSRSQAQLVVFSNEVANGLIADLKTFSSEPETDPTGTEAVAAARKADAMFNSLRIPAFFSAEPTAQIRAWEHILGILRNADEQRYAVLHKGTPFYFLGVAAYLVEDFERALYYLDCALTEDARRHGERWHEVPSGFFVRLDSLPEKQFGRGLVQQARRHLDHFSARLSMLGGVPLTLESYRTRLVNRAMHDEPELRSVVTALLSFVLEMTPRSTQLALAPVAGSGEPFYLHLFKGGLLFETLLKVSSVGRSVCALNPAATLHTLLTHPEVVAALGFSRAVQGLGAHQLDQLLVRIERDEQANVEFGLRAVQASWGIRNCTGHSIAWPNRPSAEAYERLFVLILGSISLVLDRLYSRQLLPTGIP